MQSTPHEPSFQNYQSPSLPDYKGNATTKDIESPNAEIGVGQRPDDADVYGSLRKGEPAKFFSKECAGVVAGTFASAWTCECLNCVIEPMLGQHFALNIPQLSALHRLVALPCVFSFFFGLMSDCYPIMGFRRKAYLIISLVMTVMSYFILSALNLYAESLEQGTASTSMAVCMVAFATVTGAGNMATYMCVHTRVVEFSQREPLRMRGAILGAYSIFRFMIFVVTSTCVYAVRTNVKHHSTELFVFGLVMALTVPLVWKTWQEKYYSLSTSMRTRGQILWRVVQQKAVWSTFAFLCISILFNSVRFGDSMSLIYVWAGAGNDSMLLQEVLGYSAMTLAVVLWRYCFINRPWRVFFALSTVLLVVPQSIQATVIALDIFRNRYFYHAMNFFPGMSIGVAWLASTVPLMEVTQEGSEGAMVGLMTSLYFSISIFVQVNSAGVFKGSNFYDNGQAMFQQGMDTPETRLDVLRALFLNYGINTLALFALFFLPRQKVEAQQLRSYGGYAKCASAAILTIIVGLFLISVIVIMLTLMPSTSCLRIVGGEGC